MPDTGDPLVGVAGFARALAAAGLPVASDAVETYTRALRQVDLGDPRQVYWAGRATLCRSPDDIPRYDLVFENWFGGTVPRRAHRSARQTAAPRPHRCAGCRPAPPTTGGDAPRLRVAADDTEILRHRDIAELTAAERAHLAELITALRPRPADSPRLAAAAVASGPRRPAAHRCATCSPRAANRCGPGTTARPPGRAE